MSIDLVLKLRDNQEVRVNLTSIEDYRDEQFALLSYLDKIREAHIESSLETMQEDWKKEVLGNKTLTSFAEWSKADKNAERISVPRAKYGMVAQWNSGLIVKTSEDLVDLLLDSTNMLLNGMNFFTIGLCKRPESFEEDVKEVTEENLRLAFQIISEMLIEIEYHRRHHLGGGRVSSSALVSEHAYIETEAMVLGQAGVYNNAVVSGKGLVGGYSCITDSALVTDEAVVCDYAEISGRAKVCGNAEVGGNATVSGYTRIRSGKWNITPFSVMGGNVRVNVTAPGVAWLVMGDIKEEVEFDGCWEERLRDERGNCPDIEEAIMFLQMAEKWLKIYPGE